MFGFQTKNFIEMWSQCPIENKWTLDWAMAWRRIGDKPLLKPMMTRYLTPYDVINPQGVNSSLLSESVDLTSEVTVIEWIYFNFAYRRLQFGPSLTTLTGNSTNSWWRHQMETFSALLAICAGNSPVPGEFPSQRPATRSFDVFFDLRPNKRLSKQS